MKRDKYEMEQKNWITINWQQQQRLGDGKYQSDYYKIMMFVSQ